MKRKNMSWEAVIFSVFLIPPVNCLLTFFCWDCDPIPRFCPFKPQLTSAEACCRVGWKQNSIFLFDTFFYLHSLKLKENSHKVNCIFHWCKIEASPSQLIGLSGISRATVMESIDLPVFCCKLFTDGLNLCCTILVLISLSLTPEKNHWFPDPNAC